MTTWSVTEVTEVKILYHIPAEDPYGACWSEVDTAMGAAIARYRADYQVDPIALISDDAVRVRAGDGEIIIEFSRIKQVDHK
jgi:hypothetical protein